MKKRGQGGAGGAATLVAIIGLLIILYILFLPPEQRAEMLGEAPPSMGQPGTIPTGGEVAIENFKGIVFEETPGKIDYSSLSEYEHPLPSFTLFKRTDAQIIAEINPFYVKNGWFDKKDYNFTFSINDLRNTENVMLSYTLTKGTGILQMKLNGIPIYEFEEMSVSPKPITLSKDYLQNTNVLDFSVSSVGMNFWKTNEYGFSNVKITADVTDRSKEKSFNTFFITETEGENIEIATLKFTPDCNLRDVGMLNIEINGRLAFQGIPDCGQMNKIELGSDILNIGKNQIEFTTDKGSYLVDQIMLKTELKSTAIPIYYFELQPELFTSYSEYPEEECGRIDGVCPSFCDEDSDLDCCIIEYDTPYWCDMNTNNRDDRCVGYVDTPDCARCPSGYENKQGKPPKECEKLCGDDTDNKCPAGCNADHDEDCCFNQTGDQYWCSDMPTNGLSFTCINELSRGQCEVCPTGYKAESGSVRCYPTEEVFLGEELRPEVSVLLTFKFTDDIEMKDADIFINGKMTHIQTRSSFFQKDISLWIEPGTNSIEIKPYSILNIRTLQVGII